MIYDIHMAHNWFNSKRLALKHSLGCNVSQFHFWQVTKHDLLAKDEIISPDSHFASEGLQHSPVRNPLLCLYKMTGTHLTHWLSWKKTLRVVLFPRRAISWKHVAGAFSMQHTRDECFLAMRKIQPIICQVLQALDFLYQTPVSQHGPSLQMDYSRPLHVPDSSTALPDSLHRMTQGASRQKMMDGLQTRLEKTLTTLSNNQ